jgi:hypothetical protein
VFPPRQADCMEDYVTLDVYKDLCNGIRVSIDLVKLTGIARNITSISVTRQSMYFYSCID